jgi:hypothetical protein
LLELSGTTLVLGSGTLASLREGGGDWGFKSLTSEEYDQLDYYGRREVNWQIQHYSETKIHAETGDIRGEDSPIPTPMGPAKPDSIAGKNLFEMKVGGHFLIDWLCSKSESIIESC